jgi:hypothetical protein
MTEHARLKTILEKQDAADRAQVAELTRQAIVKKQAKESQDRVAIEWRHLCRILARTAATANGAMTGGRELYLQPYNPHSGRTVVGDMIIMFEDKYSENVMQKCVVGVDLDGQVSVSIEPQNRTYNLNIWTATPEQLEGIIFDFMEANIEGTRP